MNSLQILRDAMHPNFGAGSDAEPAVTLFEHFNKLILDQVSHNRMFLAGPHANILGRHNYAYHKQGADFCR